MRWIFLEFARLDLENEVELKKWLEDDTLYYEKYLDEWVWSYVKNFVIKETREIIKSDITTAGVYELNGISPEIDSDKEIRLHWICKNRAYLSPIQKELYDILEDIKEGNQFARELNDLFPSNVNVLNMTGLHSEEKINKKFQMIRFGISIEETDSSIRRVVKPIIEDFEVLLYTELMKYINDGLDIIDCSRCTFIMTNPKMGQLRNYRRSIPAYCDDCIDIHQREKNKRLKQISRRNKKHDKSMEEQ